MRYRSHHVRWHQFQRPNRGWSTRLPHNSHQKRASHEIGEPSSIWVKRHRSKGESPASAIKTTASVGKTQDPPHAYIAAFLTSCGTIEGRRGKGRVAVITIDVNGASRQIDIEPDTPLLWVLRDVIGLTGTKFGCGIARCGACTVHVNGTAMRSCSVPIGTLEGAKIVTIEGLSPDNNHPVQRAWIEEGVPQCGYCQSGQIMAVVTFLKKYSKPTDADIDANITNICRCGTYEPLRRAIHRAADIMST
jgi:isoquinoline 1-oxidoreductase subunit alpha